jgi:uncharacterized membrane protein YdjX (TVP38/TMEM64 family)
MESECSSGARGSDCRYPRSVTDGREEPGTQAHDAVPAVRAAGDVDVGAVIKKLGVVSVLGVLAVALPPVTGTMLIVYMKTVAEWLRAHQGWGLVLYTCAFAVLSGLAVLPTYAQAALGGFAFGMPLGLPAAAMGFAGGALIGYFIARTLGKDRAMGVLKEHPTWMAVRDALVGGANSAASGGAAGGVTGRSGRSFWSSTGMVALLRMPPNSPFALTNLLMAAVKVPLGPFAAGTLLGMLPRAALAVWIGSSIGMSADGEFSTPAWLRWGGLLVGLLVLMVVLDLAERAVKRITEPGNVKPMSKTLPMRWVQAVVIWAVVVGAVTFIGQQRAAARARAAESAEAQPSGQAGQGAEGGQAPIAPANSGSGQ